MLPILKTNLPSANDLLPYLAEIDRNNIYSNFGPMYCKYTEVLSSIYKTAPSEIVGCSSATAGIQLALLEIADRLGKRPCELSVAAPNWTFQATVQAALSIGSQVRLFDVDINGVIQRLSLVNYLDSIDVVVVVAPFGAPLDYQDWERFGIEHGKEVIFDSAASFFTLQATSFCTVVSTHATKGISTGEGGFVVVRDLEKAERVKAISSFGFQGYRRSELIGINGKVSEYSCAVGLAMLARRDEIQNKLHKLSQLYNSSLAQDDSLSQPFTSVNFARTTYSVYLHTIIFDRVISWFAQRGIEVRSWWGSPISQQPIGRYCNCLSLPKREASMAHKLSVSVLGIPFGTHVTVNSAMHVTNSLRLLNSDTLP